MRTSVSFLVSLSVFLLLACTQSYSGTMSEKTVTSEPTDTAASEMEGVFTREPFVNKGGRAIANVYTYFFTQGEKDWFIKTCESELKDGDLLKYLGKKVKINGSTTKGLWDVCDGNTEQQSRYGDYVRILEVKEVMQDLNTYYYADGSANVYKITADSIEYIPVKPENSSSGTYSGGNPVKKTISKENANQIIAVFHDIIAKKPIHIENREMMTGAITIEYEKDKREVLFKRGDEMTKLETLLKAAIK